MKKNILAGLFLSAISIVSVKAADRDLKLTNHADTKQTYVVSNEKSTITWLAKKVTGEHTGNVGITTGTITSIQGLLTGGNFEINLNSITCTDLTDPGYNGKLIGHLKSADFFDVEKFPTSTLKVKVWAPIKDAKDGAPNFYVKGDLTIKGVTKEITFPAIVNISEKTITATADFNVDRTEYDLKYHSSKFDPGIGDKMINDEFNLKINLTANVK